jgi:hypothetical protein
MLQGKCWDDETAGTCSQGNWFGTKGWGQVTSRSLRIEEVLNLLPRTPARIAELTAELTPGQLHAIPKPDEWSINDVLAHLRACADVWGDCIEMIVAQNESTLRAVNPRTWIKKTGYPDQEFMPSLQAFTTQRGKLLALVETLEPHRWAHTATVTGAGKPLQLTVLSYAQRLARHERSHIKQIKQLADGWSS